MERFNKKLLLITLLIGIFLLTGCDKIKSKTFDASDEDATNAVTSVPNDNAGDTTDNDEGNNDNSNDKKNNDATPTKAAKTLEIYSVTEEGELEPVTALVPDGSEITPDFIVDKVIEALSDEMIVIVKDSVSAQKDEVIVSFKKDGAPYSVTDSDEMEANILNAIAQSLLDNLKESNYKKVFFRVEGKEYKSDSFYLELDEPYMQE